MDYEFIDPKDFIGTEENIMETSRRWKNVFSYFLAKNGYNETAINDLFEWGKGGHNWELLWHKHESKTLEDVYYSFYWEYAYCSDRMSLDRLFRCHWEYNGLLIKYKEELRKLKD